MPTDLDTARIRAEEILRDEIRADLARNRPRSPFERIIRAFNSSLGIWLLSTCVVGLATWLYAGWQTEREAAQRRQARIAVLDAQVAARLRAVEHLLGDPKSMGLSTLKLMAALQQLSAFNVLQAQTGAPIQQEQQGQQRQAVSTWTLPELIWELQGLTPGVSAAELTKAAVIAEDLQVVTISTLPKLFEAADHMWVRQNDPRIEPELLEIRRSVSELLKVSRWSGVVGGIDPRAELRNRSTHREAERAKYFAERKTRAGKQPSSPQKTDDDEDEDQAAAKK